MLAPATNPIKPISKFQSVRLEKELRRTLSDKRSKSGGLRRPDSVAQIFNPKHPKGEDGAYQTSNSGIGRNLVFDSSYSSMQAPVVHKGG